MYDITWVWVWIILQQFYIVNFFHNEELASAFINTTIIMYLRISKSCISKYD